MAKKLIVRLLIVLALAVVGLLETQEPALAVNYCEYDCPSIPVGPQCDTHVCWCGVGRPNPFKTVCSECDFTQCCT
jgi:hypothetical protein